jgi:hypothetical protein
MRIFSEQRGAQQSNGIVMVHDFDHNTMIDHDCLDFLPSVCTNSNLASGELCFQLAHPKIVEPVCTRLQAPLSYAPTPRDAAFTRALSQLLSDPEVSVLEEDEETGYIHALVLPAVGDAEDLELQVLPGA